MTLHNARPMWRCDAVTSQLSPNGPSPTPEPAEYCRPNRTDHSVSGEQLQAGARSGHDSNQAPRDHRPDADAVPRPGADGGGSVPRPLQHQRSTMTSLSTMPDALTVPERPNYIYVASSWRNPMQPAICAALRSANLDHYDFRNPEPGNDGFRWTDVDPEWSRECRCDHTRGAHGFCAAHGEAPTMGRGCSCPKGDGTTSPESYLRAIEHPVAVAGYDLDFAAMEKADTFVLVLPCGRSAHLELGWAVGAGKRTAILLDDPVTPELMYRMVDYVAPSLFDLLGWLGVED